MSGAGEMRANQGRDERRWCRVGCLPHPPPCSPSPPTIGDRSCKLGRWKKKEEKQETRNEKREAKEKQLRKEAAGQATRSNAHRPVFRSSFFRRPPFRRPVRVAGQSRVSPLRHIKANVECCSAATLLGPSNATSSADRFFEAEKEAEQHLEGGGREVRRATSLQNDA